MTTTIELDGPVTDVEQALAELRSNVEYGRLHVRIRVVPPRGAWQPTDPASDEDRRLASDLNRKETR